MQELTKGFSERSITLIAKKHFIHLTLRKAPKVYELKVSLMGTAPLVWRSFLAHDFIELSELHMLIQMTMGWENSHLYEFKINGKSYSDAESSEEMDNYLDADGTLLCDVLTDSTEFEYIYDFGDGWQHKVEIVKSLEHDPRMNYPTCIGGENACPPEDCGGVHAFSEFKKVIAGKNGAAKDELLTWVGGFYNPTTFDPNLVNRLLLWADIL